MSTNERFEIPCPQCGTLVAVLAAHVGRKGRCPACKAVFPIVAQPDAEPVVDELAPAPAWQPGLQPLPPGWQPLPATWQPQAPTQQHPHLIPLRPPHNGWQNAAALVGQGAAAAGPSLFDDLNPPQPPTTRDDIAAADDRRPHILEAERSHAQDVFKRLAEKEKWQQEKVREALNGVMWSGVGMMAFAVVWFVAGLYFGVIFFRDPPILFVVGVAAFVKGLLRSPH